MIEKSLLAFWGAWVLLLLVAAFRVLGFSIARRHQDRRLRDGSGPQKPVALILPAKGFDLQGTPRFFDSLFGQTYRDYRVIVCFESWEDPVALWLCEHLELGPHRPVWTHPDPASGLRSVTLVCAGLAENEGQKVHNQRAAFADLTSRDAIVAFADADILCGRDWLARLVAPINRGTHELSTTYRWLVPKRPTLPNQLACVINASIATQAGSAFLTFLWGGSMAVTREVFTELDVPKLLAGSLNDDLRLSKAARATGRKIAFVRSLLLPTPVDYTWGGFFEFVRRQYTQVKFFGPILYACVNFVFAFYMLGLASIVGAIVYGYFFAWIPLAAAYVIDQFRALARQQIYLGLFRDDGIRQKLFATSWLEHMFTPVWITLHWLLFASTWTQNRLTWAGIRYRIRSKSETRVLHRAPATATLPAGAPGLAMIGALHDLRRVPATQPIRPATQPIRPASLPAAAVSTATVSEKTAEVAEVAVAEIAVAEAPAPAAAPAKEAAEAISLATVPEAPSAIQPLAAGPRERREGRSPRPAPRRRGAVSAVAAALRKSRLFPPVLHPAARTESAPPVEPPAAAVPGLPAPPRRAPLSSAERLRRKERTEAGGAKFRKSASPRPPSPTPLPAPLARLASRTRLFPAIARRSPDRPAPAPTKSPRDGSPDLRPAASTAARRAGRGGSFRNEIALQRPPARSSRTAPAARPAGTRPARPVARGASSRP